MINTNPQKRIITNEELYDFMVSSISDLRKSTLDGFDRVFEVMDENTKQIKDELKTDINNLRVELKNEMNQRFSFVDKQFILINNRLSGIEENMVYKHEVFPKFV